MLGTYALFGVARLWRETSPVGWWMLKPRPMVWPVVIVYFLEKAESLIHE
jgi:hypothetical protein